MCTSGRRPTVDRYADLAIAIREAPARCGRVRLVAIDGPGGSGKTLFADRLARALETDAVVHTDDFASWEEPLDWWGRLEAEVLAPLARGEPVAYQPYDWLERRLAERRDLPARDVVVLEGVSSARRAVADRLTRAVWVETSLAERLARGLARDGEVMRDRWAKWMAEEDAHYAADRTRDRADLVVDGAPSTPHDPETEYVRLR